MVVDEAGSWKLRAEAEENGSLLQCKKLGGRSELLRARSGGNASSRTVSGAAILFGCVVVELCCSFVELCMHLSGGF